MSTTGDQSGSHAHVDQPIGAEELRQLYEEHASGIRAFLIGLLRNRELAEEVQQAVFLKALEVGGTVQVDRFRGWLFRVANNEAMSRKRREGVDRRAMEKVAQSVGRQETVGSVVDRIGEKELFEKAVAALKQIPEEQQEVVRLRIYEGMKFAEIASHTGVPLGTVLTRMRLALARLSKTLPKDED
ncbi:MAG: RNA polymerase sigma factor [Planctomycetaceae bacterium]